METGGAIPGQETGSGSQIPVNPDGFVTIDVESFTPVFHKDLSSSSPRFTRSVSRKGSPRSNNERKINCDANGNDKETSFFPQSPLRAEKNLRTDCWKRGLAAIAGVVVMWCNRDSPCRELW